MAAPLGLAVIGTNWITNSFVQSCHQSGRFLLKAVYSRKLDTAQKFISETPSVKDVSSVTAYDDLDKLLAEGSGIDALYIASPNALHYEQGIKGLTAGKHVIMEKPFASNTKELEGLYKLADSKGLFILEAWRHIQEPNFRKLQSLLDDEKTRTEKFGPILAANLSMAVYTPIYAQLLAGEEPNLFSAKLSGGCLWDMGCYIVMFNRALFGKPASQSYSPVMLRTGVDGGGHVLFNFTPETSKHKQTFTVYANMSKLYSSVAPTEIFCEKGTIRVKGDTGVTDLNSIEFVPNDESKPTEQLADTNPDYTGILNLTWEAKELGRIIQEGDRKAEGELRRLSIDVLGVMEDMRKANGIVFGCEK